MIFAIYKKREGKLEWTDKEILWKEDHAGSVVKIPGDTIKGLA
jgi:hypothetical protein